MVKHSHLVFGPVLIIVIILCSVRVTLADNKYDSTIRVYEKNEYENILLKNKLSGLRSVPGSYSIDFPGLRKKLQIKPIDFDKKTKQPIYDHYIRGFASSSESGERKGYITEDHALFKCERISDLCPAAAVSTNGMSYYRVEYISEPDEISGKRYHQVKFLWLPDGFISPRSAIATCADCKSQIDKAKDAAEKIEKKAVELVKPPAWKFNACGFKESPHTISADNIKIVATVVGKKCVETLPDCGNPQAPRNLKLVELLNLARDRDVRRGRDEDQCGDLVSDFYSKCSLLVPKTKTERAEFIRNRLREVLTKTKSDYPITKAVIDSFNKELHKVPKKLPGMKNPPQSEIPANVNVTHEDVILCVMRKENPDFNPSMLRGGACNTKSSIPSDYGLGQFILDTPDRYFQYYKMESDPEFAEFKKLGGTAAAAQFAAKYKDPRNKNNTSNKPFKTGKYSTVLHYQLGENVDLQIELLALMLEEKIKTMGTLSGGIKYYDGLEKNKPKYWKDFRSCVVNLKKKKNSEISEFLSERAMYD